MPIAPGAIVNAPDILALGLVKVQSGSAAAAITAATNTSVVVNFPAAFVTSPQVFVTIRTAAGTAVGSFVQITALSTTSVTIRWGLPASGTTSCTLDWLAISTA